MKKSSIDLELENRITAKTDEFGTFWNLLTQEERLTLMSSLVEELRNAFAARDKYIERHTDA